MPDHTVLPTAVAAAVGCIPTADFVSVTVVDAVGPWTVAVSHPLARRLDGLQYLLSEGPFFDAMTADGPVTCTDLGAAAGWPEFAPRAVLNGVHAIMAVRLPTEHGAGALNIYCAQPGEFDAATRSAAGAVAAELTVTLGSARRIANLTMALQSRDVIGQAKGIVMERYKIGADAAFALLSRLSQERNIKLRDLAAEVTTTGLVDPPR